MTLRQMCRPEQFQFPPLREGRLGTGVIPSNGTDFNSRPCARGDSKFKQIRSSQFVRTSQLKGCLPAFLRHVMGKTLL